MGLILIIIILLLLFGGGGYGYRRGWGPGPLGGYVGIILIILVVLYLLGYIRLQVTGEWSMHLQSYTRLIYKIGEASETKINEVELALSFILGFP